MNDHTFKDGKVSQYLIRNYEIVTVEYPKDDLNDANNKWPVPIGLEKHDVHIIKQSQINAKYDQLISKDQVQFNQI